VSLDRLIFGSGGPVGLQAVGAAKSTRSCPDSWSATECILATARPRSPTTSEGFAETDYAAPLDAAHQPLGDQAPARAPEAALERRFRRGSRQSRAAASTVFTPDSRSGELQFKVRLLVDMPSRSGGCPTSSSGGELCRHRHRGRDSAAGNGGVKGVGVFAVVVVVSVVGCRSGEAKLHDRAW
jgi:hypothetical protein